MAVKHSLYHETGKLSVDREHCTLCGVCVKNCGVEVLQIKDKAVQQVDAGFGCICSHCRRRMRGPTPSRSKTCLLRAAASDALKTKPLSLY